MNNFNRKILGGIGVLLFFIIFVLFKNWNSDEVKRDNSSRKGPVLSNYVGDEGKGVDRPISNSNSNSHLGKMDTKPKEAVPFVPELENPFNFEERFDSHIHAEEFAEAGNLLSTYAYYEMTASGGTYSREDLARHFDLIKPYLKEHPLILESAELLDTSIQLATQLKNHEYVNKIIKVIRSKKLDPYKCYEYIAAVSKDKPKKELSKLIISCAEDPDNGSLYFADHISYLLRNRDLSLAKEDYSKYLETHKNNKHIDSLIKKYSED